MVTSPRIGLNGKREIIKQFAAKQHVNLIKFLLEHPKSFRQSKLIWSPPPSIGLDGEPETIK